MSEALAAFSRDFDHPSHVDSAGGGDPFPTLPACARCGHSWGAHAFGGPCAAVTAYHRCACPSYETPALSTYAISRGDLVGLDRCEMHREGRVDDDRRGHLRSQRRRQHLAVPGDHVDHHDGSLRSSRFIFGRCAGRRGLPTFSCPRMDPLEYAIRVRPLRCTC